MKYFLLFITITTLFIGCNSGGNSTQETPSTINEIEEALAQGDENLTSQATLLREIRVEIDALCKEDPALESIYTTNTIVYDPTQNSQYFIPYGDKHHIFPLIYGNKGDMLALGGYRDKSAFALFGADIFYAFAHQKNLQYQENFTNLMQWLLQNNTSYQENNTTIALTCLQDPTDTQAWLEKTFPTASVQQCNNLEQLKSCTHNATLVIFGNTITEDLHEQLHAMLETNIQTGASLLYIHPNWGINAATEMINDFFEVSMNYGGNWWDADKAMWDTSEAMYSAYTTNMGYRSIDTIVSHFQNQDYHFDWSQCDGENCDGVENLESDFYKGAKQTQSFLQNLDLKKKDIFATTQYRLEKLLILLGDKLRQKITYPMDKMTTDDTQFMEAYFADYALYNTRNHTKAQKDLGNFSRTNFSHALPHTKTLTLQTKKNFQATGIYMLPGVTMNITRNDTLQNVKIKLFINTLRSGSTHQFATDGYKRPKFLQTPHYTIQPNETLTLSSPYGGVVEIESNASDYNISLTFENIEEHPIWRSKNDDATFTQAMQERNFDWAELVTPGFEVHSTLDKMEASINNPQFQTPQALANATQHYISNYPYLLAGFHADGVDRVEEIETFAQEHNLSFQTIDTVQHMNADQATCGYGCSGNPYDAYWAFSPVAHGDLHELGHGLEKHRFIFEGFELHSITNPYSYYTKSQYNLQTGNDGECQELPFEEVFTKLQAALNEENATQYLQENLWNSSNWSQQVLVLIEAMMHTQKQHTLQNGWHLLARLHLLEHASSWAQQDWQNRKHFIGFDTYTLEAFQNIRNNDWLLISYSFAGELDFRGYFDRMGITYSQAAAQAVENFHFPPVANTFIVSTPSGYCSKDDTFGPYLDKISIELNTTTTWPQE